MNGFIEEVERKLKRYFAFEGYTSHHIQLDFEDYSHGKIWFDSTKGWFVRCQEQNGVYLISQIKRQDVLRCCALIYFLTIDDEAIARSEAHKELSESIGFSLYKLNAQKFVKVVKQKREVLDKYIRESKRTILSGNRQVMNTEWSISYLLNKAIVEMTRGS